MKKKIALLGLICIVFQLGLHGQGKQVDAGVKLYENGRYEEAIAELDAALAQDLKEKDKAKASYHRAAAQITFLRRMKSWENLPPAMTEKVQRYALNAAIDLGNVTELDEDKKYASELKNWERKGEGVLMGLGHLALLEADKPTKTDAQRKAHFEAAVTFADACIPLDKFNYAPYNLKGEGLLGLQDSVEALVNFRLADDNFFRSAPKSGDLSIAYTYMHIARLEKALNGDLDAAQKAIAKGQEQLNGEHKKIQVFSNLRPEEKATMDREYQDINAKLAKVGEQISGK